MPTVDRPSLRDLLRSLARQAHPPRRVVVVDDRRAPEEELDLSELDLSGPDVSGTGVCGTGLRVVVRRSGGRGPATARNVGWAGSEAQWIVFLDDDVRPSGDWSVELAEDLAEAEAEPSVGAVQGRISVPLDPRATDWERSVGRLADAPWITADMAVRSAALRSIGGFDASFPRAYREDSDLAIRLRQAGWVIQQGERRSTHPVGGAPWWESVRRQRGNADDARLLVRHGWRWRRLARAPRGRRPLHVLTTAALVLAVTGGRGRLGRAARLAWLLSTAQFTTLRWWAASRTARELPALAVTSAAIPPAACWWWARGLIAALRPQRRAAAVLFDRDGTLVVDVPYNGDPDLVRVVDDAPRAVEAIRAAGVPVAVVSNQSGVARGLIAPADVEAVNERVDVALGGLDAWEWCGHSDGDGCDRRKPGPGLIEAAAERLGVRPERCVVIGDIGSDVDAARAAGATPILVPTAATRREEVLAAPIVVERLGAAAELALLEPRP